RLFVEPQGSRALLQHARRLSWSIRQRTVSPGNGGESELLAGAGRPEQRKHDHWPSRLDERRGKRSGGVPGNSDGWLRSNGESHKHAGQHSKETCYTAGALNCNCPGVAVEAV